MWRGGATLAASALSIALTAALPASPRPPARPRLLELEARYPSPLRSALELEIAYRRQPAVDAARGAIALTFDTEIPRGGEARRTINEILDVRRDEGAPATFFVVGTWARANGDVLRRMVAEGHEIAHHSLDHRPYSGRRVAEIERDLDAVAEVVARETGTAIAPLFRPPYGCVDATAARVVSERGYALAGWTAAGADAHGRTASPLEVVGEIDRDLGPGAVVLLHTNRWITAAALPWIVDSARQRGLATVTLSALMADDAARRAELERRVQRPCGALLAWRGGGGEQG
jgi:peptidoglycan/xylan/chitin deacetylase (PgdA/CDA1 family)